MNEIKITDKVKIGGNNPFALIAGPCVLESKEICFEIVEKCKNLCEKLGITYIFKASFDKANRSSIDSFRGTGIEESKKMFQLIKKTFQVPILTDIHEKEHPILLADSVDYLQIPAFLCRQTDLLLAAGKSKKAINIKKGQFLSPQEMENIVNKVEATGNNNFSLCERGTSFGYNNLIVDMRSLIIMKEFKKPIVFDATHSVQLPGGLGSSSGGQPEFILPLAKAATAIGIDALFMEVHPIPEKAKSDGKNSLPLKNLKDVLNQVIKIHNLNKP